MTTTWLTRHDPFIICSDIGQDLKLTPTDCAYALWSRITEPDDDVASALISHLGPLDSWQWLREAGFTSCGQLRDTITIPPEMAEHTPRAQATITRRFRSWAPRIEAMDIRRELRTMVSLHGRVLTANHPHWPEGLSELNHPPLCLWVRGHSELLRGCSARSLGACATPGEYDDGGTGEQSSFSSPIVAMVGARACTRTGSTIAEEIAEYLAGHNCIIMSGGAFGIDADATVAALRHGPVIAVSAGGIDRYYPQAHREMFERIIAQGLYVSEVPPGSVPARHRFLSRNRLIAAISQATIVVEAAWRSGALSTAAHARNLGRHLGAVPGNVYSPSSAGCHKLLRDGATCITNGPEALELVTPLTTPLDEQAQEMLPLSSLPASSMREKLRQPQSDECRIWEALPLRRGAPIRSIAIAAGTSLDDTARVLSQLCHEHYAALKQGLWRRGENTP